MSRIRLRLRHSTAELKTVVRPYYWRLASGAWQSYLRSRWLAIRALRLVGWAPGNANPLRGFHASTREWFTGWSRRGGSGAFYREIDPTPAAYGSEPSILEGRPGVRPPLSGPLTVPPPPLFAAAIPGGRVYGKDAAVIAPDGRLLVDGCGIHPSLPFRERGAFPTWSVRVFPPLQVLPGRVAVLAAWHANRNYFHWMFNVLPRLELLRLAGVDLDSIDRFIVNRPHLPFQHETLARLGVAESRLLFNDEGFYVRADSLLVTSSLRFSGSRTPAVLAFLRRELLAGAARQPIDRARLFVSRADAAGRRLLNEDECLHELRPLGFEKVVLGTMSVREQAVRFAGAGVVVAPHGAGLANLAFCEPGTTVVELCSPAELRSHYMSLSQCMGLHHHWMVGEEEPGNSCRDFRVHPAALARGLGSIGIR